MKRLLQTGIALLATLLFVGCDKQILPSQAKIQVNVPDEPHPGTRTKVITFDVEVRRDVFVSLFTSTKRVGMCNPRGIEESKGAHEVMTVSYWGEAVKDRMTLHILKKPSGEWITTGYGGVEICDDPQGFPEYRYSRRVLHELKQWYEEHVSVNDRKR